jgi:hypothetical protein
MPFGAVALDAERAGATDPRPKGGLDDTKAACGASEVRY